MAKIFFEDSEEEYDLPDDAPIAEICEQAGVPFACTEGVCGTCVIEVTEGMENLSDFNQAESDFFRRVRSREARLPVQNQKRLCENKILRAYGTEITREMTIEDVFKSFPGKGQKLAQEMTRIGLQCVGCCASTWETDRGGDARSRDG